MIKRSVLALVAIFSMLFVTVAFAANGNAAKEISMAEMHATFASTVKDVNMVHAHLHHTLNCLVGPKGKLFDPKAMDPCKGMGNGALSDLGKAPKVRAKLEMAIKHAERGLRADKYATAHAAAVRTAALVKAASAMMK